MTQISRDRDAMTGPETTTPAQDALLTAGLLHDLAHQIMTISLLAEALQADSGLSPEGRRRSKLMAAEAARALGMIDDASRAAAPRSREDDGSQLTDVRLVAARACEMAAAAHQATVKLLPGGPAYVAISPILVWRVLRNLVDNAARAAGPGGQVELTIGRSSGTEIIVADDGPGPGRGRAGSAGLGLPVVRQLLAAAGGELEISERPGGGTVARAVFGGQRDCIVIPRGRGRRAVA